jgi:hypothetical protein
MLIEMIDQHQTQPRWYRDGPAAGCGLGKGLETGCPTDLDHRANDTDGPQVVVDRVVAQPGEPAPPVNGSRN